MQTSIYNDIRPKNPLLYIKYQILEWRWDLVLKRSGHTAWVHYFRHADPDFQYRGQTVREQFSGYPYLAIVPYAHLTVEVCGMWGPVASGRGVVDWCNRNCRGKFRPQWERVIQDNAGQYCPNGIGGADELFFGFKDERDYIMFILRWS